MFTWVVQPPLVPLLCSGLWVSGFIHTYTASMELGRKPILILVLGTKFHHSSVYGPSWAGEGGVYCTITIIRTPPQKKKKKNLFYLLRPLYYVCRRRPSSSTKLSASNSGSAGPWITCPGPRTRGTGFWAEPGAPKRQAARPKPILGFRG